MNKVNLWLDFQVNKSKIDNQFQPLWKLLPDHYKYNGIRPAIKAEIKQS